MKKIKLPSAIRKDTHEEVYAKTALKNFQYLCPHCLKPVFLKKGRVRVPHFAHFSPCLGAIETLLHKRCKTLIADYFPKRIRLRCDEWFEFDHAHIEYQFGSLRVDVMLIAKNGDRLAVEICVTHPLDQKKIGEFRKADCQALEIVVDLTDAELTDGDLQLKLIHEIANKEDFFPVAQPAATPLATYPPIDPKEKIREILSYILLAFIIAGILYLIWPKSRKKPAFAYSRHHRRRR